MIFSSFFSYLKGEKKPSANQVESDDVTYEDVYVLVKKSQPMTEVTSRKRKNKQFQSMRRQARKNYRQKLKCSHDPAQMEAAMRHYLQLAQGYYKRFGKPFDLKKEVEFIKKANAEVNSWTPMPPSEWS